MITTTSGLVATTYFLMVTLRWLRARSDDVDADLKSVISIKSKWLFARNVIFFALLCVTAVTTVLPLELPIVFLRMFIVNSFVLSRLSFLFRLVYVAVNRLFEFFLLVCNFGFVQSYFLQRGFMGGYFLGLAGEKSLLLGVRKGMIPSSSRQRRSEKTPGDKNNSSSKIHAPKPNGVHCSQSQVNPIAVDSQNLRALRDENESADIAEPSPLKGKKHSNFNISYSTASTLYECSMTNIPGPPPNTDRGMDSTDLFNKSEETVDTVDCDCSVEVEPIKPTNSKCRTASRRVSQRPSPDSSQLSISSDLGNRSDDGSMEFSSND